MSIVISTTGSFDKTTKFLEFLSSGRIFDSLETYAERGVAALAAATPEATGKTANSWSYEVVRSGGTYSIYWTNSDMDEEGTPIVILLQYGHGTGTGGYVQGRNFILPAIVPIFDQISADVWKAVQSA
jgi:hypothetical protein